jgi:hypothetical protein
MKNNAPQKGKRNLSSISLPKPQSLMDTRKKLKSGGGWIEYPAVGGNRRYMLSGGYNCCRILNPTNIVLQFTKLPLLYA